MSERASLERLQLSLVGKSGDREAHLSCGTAWVGSQEDHGRRVARHMGFTSRLPRFSVSPIARATHGSICSGRIFENVFCLWPGRLAIQQTHALS